MSDTRIVTGKVRASYLNVFTMRDGPNGGKPSYSVALLIPKSDKETLAKIKKAQTAVLADKFGGKKPSKFDNGLRDGDDVADEKGEAYADHYYINAKSTQNKPGVIARDKTPITDATQFVSGDYCRASINAYGYDTSGNRGVGWGLNNIQMLSKGEPLGNITSADDDFADDFEGDDDDDDFPV